MEILIKNPAIKRISFSDFEKRFYVALRSDVSNSVIFYRFIENQGIELSFCFDNFVMITFSSFEETIELFPNAENDADVVLATKNKTTHPSVTKFINHYTYNRGIREL